MQTGSSAFEAAPTPMLVADGAGMVVTKNHAWRSLCQPDDPLAGSKPSDRVIDDVGLQRFGLAGAVVGFILEGPPQTLVAQERADVASQSEAPRTMRVHVAAFFSPEAKQHLILIALHDITQEAQQLAQSRAAYQQIRAVIDHSPVLIFVKDLQHRMVLASQEMTRLFSLQEGDLDREHLEHQDAADVHEWDDIIARDGVSRDIQETLQTTIGERHFSTVKFPVRDVSGAIIGDILVALACADEQPSQDQIALKLSVTDAGIGIRADDSAKLFVAFSQADSSISRRFGGTGLGLAISKGIVEAMGSSVTVDSVFGRGSTFSLQVPLRPFMPIIQDGATGTTASVPQLQGRVLVAEDNAINQTIILHQLEKLGLTAVLANDGAAAYQLARDEDFDLILMDCHMPNMDGFAATQHIRALASDTRSSVPIVALTANALAGERQRCLEAAMTDYLSKPVRLADLHACLAQHLAVKS